MSVAQYHRGHEQKLDWRKTILLVDDNPEFRGFLRELLDHEGYQVVEVVNGRDALDIITTRRPGLIVTDIYMPEMDGIELIRAVRERCPKIAIIALSGGEPNVGYDASYVDVAKRLGADYGFCKPLDVSVFLAVVEELLDVEQQDESATVGT